MKAKVPKKPPSKIARDKARAEAREKRAKEPQVGYKHPPDSSKWKPGQSGNPLGGMLHKPKVLQNLTKQELVTIGNLIIKGEYDELQALAKEPKATVLQRMLASVAVKVIEKGDMGALDVLLNRMVGKVKDEVEHTANLIAPPQIIVSMPANGREAEDIDLGF